MGAIEKNKLIDPDFYVADDDLGIRMNNRAVVDGLNEARAIFRAIERATQMTQMTRREALRNEISRPTELSPYYANRTLGDVLSEEKLAKRYEANTKEILAQTEEFLNTAGMNVEKEMAEEAKEIETYEFEDESGDGDIPRPRM